MMNRRTLMTSIAGAGTFAALPARAASLGRPRIAIVGAGIMGVSIAYHLSKRGADVVVIDKGEPGGGATQGAFALLIAAHDGGDRAFNDLYGKAILDWRRLEMELRPSLDVQWGGAAIWAPAGKATEDLNAARRKLEGWGAPVENMTIDDLRRLIPGVEPGPFGSGYFSPTQGTLNPMQIVNALVASGRAGGVQYRFPCEVTGLISRDGKITTLLTDRGPVTADVFVLAAGAGLPALAGEVGVSAPINLITGTLSHSQPYPRVLERVINGPFGSLKQDPDGRIVVGSDYRPGAGTIEVSRARGEQMLRDAARTLPSIKGATFDRMTLGHVPVPRDTRPIVGFAAGQANLYLALTMSGITMAPLIGRYAAAEIIDGVAIENLAAYRPSRFS